LHLADGFLFGDLETSAITIFPDQRPSAPYRHTNQINSRGASRLNPGAFKPFRKSNLNCDAGERI